ncbi:MAG: hypothetical protein ACOX84_02260 [Methanothrix sp.]|jgi:hypothetical protein|uniref:hypothetical protein n=1 Tax=Methanothrix sp. TaxID=90426 RepID=UPI003D94F18A
MLTRHSSMTSPGQQREPTSPPLPEGAVVSDLVMWVDGTAVHGEILEADEAREVRPMRQCLRRVQILDIEDEGAAGRGPIPPNPADPGSYSSISPLA